MQHWIYGFALENIHYPILYKLGRATWSPVPYRYVRYGPPSDHAALTIHLNLPNGNLLPKKRKKAILKATKKINNHILRTSGAATFKNKVSNFIPSLMPEEITSLPHTKLLDHFEKHIVHAATEATQIELCNRPNWFMQSETILLKLITIRNHAYKLYVQNRNELTHTNLQTARSNLQREKRNAKQRWQLHFAERCKREDFKTNPKSAWDIMFKLIEGFQGHHRS